MIPRINSWRFRLPSASIHIWTARQPRSLFGTKEHNPFDSASGSIGTTRSGKYTELPRSLASLSSGLPGRTYQDTSAIATIRCQPPSFFGSGSCSAQTASSKSRASAPSMVTSGMRRRSVRPRAEIGFAVSASASAPGEKSTGMSFEWMAIKLGACGPKASPTTSAMRASGRPKLRPPMACASTRSPLEAPFSSPGGMTNSLRIRRFVGITLPLPAII